MLRIVVRPLSQQALAGASTPTYAGQGECIPWVYYDTQSYTSAGTAGPIAYFQSVQSDKTLGNIDQGGQLPAGYYFQINSFQLDWFGLPSNQTAAAATTAPVGSGNDLFIIFFTARALFQFVISSKLYVQVPATYLHASGYPVVVTAGAYAAATQDQFVGNSYPDGDYYIGNNIVIPPQQAFNASLIFAGANAISATTNIRIGMAGALTRRVL